MSGRPPEPISQRLARSYRVGPGGCWLWTASTRKDGYGQIWTSAGDGPRRLLSAHRAMWELLRGPIPDGLDLDHLCRVRLCVNPEHLEPVSRRTNVLRGHGPAAANARRTLCLLGHPLVLVSAGGKRGCPRCDRRRSAQRRQLLLTP